MRRLLVTAVLGALIASGLTSSPANADAWVPAPALAGVGDIAGLVGGVEPVWVAAGTNQIRTATLQDDKTWSAPRTIAEPSGPPTLVSNASGVVTYTVGSSLFQVAGDGTTRTLSTSVVPGTVFDGVMGLLWAETVAGGLERVMTDEGFGRAVEVRAPAATHYFSLAATNVNRGEDDGTMYAWVAGSDADAARAWVQDPGHAPVQVSTGPTRTVGLGWLHDDLVTWTQEDSTGTGVYFAARPRKDKKPYINVGQPWTKPVKLSAGSPVAGSTVTDMITWSRGSDPATVSWREEGPGGWAVRDATVDNGSWTRRTLDSGTGTLGAASWDMADGVTAWCAPVAGGCQVRGVRPNVSTYAVLGDSADADARVNVHYLHFRGSYSDLAFWTDGPDLKTRALDKDAQGTFDYLTWSMPRLTFTGRATATWSTEDDWSKIASYRVRANDWGPTTQPHNIRTGMKVLDAATLRTSRTLAVRDGHTRCIEVWVRDTAGNPWPLNTACVTAPLDDRVLKRSKGSKGWTAVRDTGSFHHTLLRTTRKGATLTYAPSVPNVAFSGAYFSVVFRRAPGAGKIVLESATGHGWRSKVFDLSGPSARRAVVGAPWPHARKVRIRVVSSGKPVLIDGLSVRDHNAVG